MSEVDVCVCPVAGYCSRAKPEIAKRKMTSRMHELCREDARYRAFFWGLPDPGPDAAYRIAPSTPSTDDEPRMVPCLQRGEPTGETVLCEICGSWKGKQLPVFACSAPENQDKVCLHSRHRVAPTQKYPVCVTCKFRRW